MPVFLAIVLLSSAQVGDTSVPTCDDPEVEIVCFYMRLPSDEPEAFGWSIEQSDMSAIVLTPLEAFFEQDFAPRRAREWKAVPTSTAWAIRDNAIRENHHVFVRGTFSADRRREEILVELRQPWFSSFKLDSGKSIRVPNAGAILLRSSRNLTAEYSDFLLIRCRLKEPQAT